MAISISSSPSVLVEEDSTLLTLTISSDEPIPEGGLELTVSSETVNALGQFDVFAAQPDNLQILGVTDDTNGFRVRLNEQTGTITLPVFDDSDEDSPLDLTFSVEPGEGYTVDENAGSVTLTIEDAEGGMTTPEPTPEPPTTSPSPEPGVLQVSLFGGPSYLIEDEGTVSAHAFLATNGTIPEGGLVVSVDAPNLSEFDLPGVLVEGGEIVEVRDGGFDLLMTEYTTLVNLPIADDGETEAGETATFSLVAGDGYEIVADYSGGSFNLVDTASDIPQGVISEPNDIISQAVDTKITPENPSFFGSDAIYFDIGNRYLNEDGTYAYVDYSEDDDYYKVELSTGDTIAIETFDVEGNLNSFGSGNVLITGIYNANGNLVENDQGSPVLILPDIAAPDKLFGGIDPFDDNETDTYLEFTAPEDGIYYVGILGEDAFGDNLPDSQIPNSGSGNRIVYGNYEINIDLLTEDNPRNVGTPTPPVSNPGITEPPTLSLSANPTTTDSEGNFTSAVVEFVEDGGLSGVNFTIQAEGEVPEEGIEFVLNSNANLFDYVSFAQQSSLPSTIGGQSLGAFYDETGTPTGIRLLIEEPTMTVTLESASSDFFAGLFAPYLLDTFEPLETDGAEDVNFFLQPGEGYEIATDAGKTEVTYYDSLEDVPTSIGGGGTVPEVGVRVSETQLIETEETETTLTFTLSEPPPTEGVTVYLDSEQDPVVGSVLSQFDVLNAEISGGNFPVPNSDLSGFFFTITEQTASITLSAFDELTADSPLPPDAFLEGILALDFALQPQSGYTIDPDAREISITIADTPESQIQVSLAGSADGDESSTTLIESEGTVSVHTFSLGAPPPAEGLTVSVSASSLGDFDLDAIEVQGGSIANLRNDGFDLTITETEATISLPVLEDGTNEGNETAVFTLEPGEGYQLNPAATEATFTIADNLAQVSVPEESEDNSTIADANALGLSADNPSVSLGGTTGLSFLDLPEDVDFFSFNLEAGQTVSLDIDAGEWNTLDLRGLPIVYPGLSDVQTTDHELRLFDAEGNEIAANNDGAAPGEDFSRDPFIEYTATESGTYYVGVSQLGNDNYDPNVARSGSGWTFPEAGVFVGPYELTASLEDGTTDPETPTTQPIFGSLEGDIIEVTGTSQLIFGGDSDDLIDASISSTGSNRIYAGSGEDTVILGMSDRIVGGEGADKFFATSGGDNILTGGAGADQFWIATAETPDAANIITDFTAGEDVLGIAGLGIGFDDLSITQQEDNTLIAANASDLAILQGIGADSLIVDNFAFA